MMDRTDRHFRVVLRQLTRRTLLYTEMITAQAVLHGDRELLLGFSPEEHPVALQLGGDDPVQLAAAAKIGEAFGYDEINLNAGCPSDRVQSGRFGACLMARPEHVRELLASMRAAVQIPVTIKHRIGIDDLDRYEDLLRFVDVVSESGADRFTVHARKAHLQGLSPAENRTVPPLRYPDVHRLKRERPELTIELNGGIQQLEAAEAQLQHVDAVMIGRAAYEDTWIFAGADRRFFGEPGPAKDRHQAIEALYPYIEAQLSKGRRLHAITRHLLAMFTGVRGARAFKRALSENATRPAAGIEVLARALALVPREDERASAPV